MRRLAYPIRKGSQTFLEGSYFLTRFSTDTVAPRELEPQLNLGENILRYLLVNADSVNIAAPTTADFTPREPGPRRFDQRRGPGGPFRGPPPPPGGPQGAPPAARAGAPADAPAAIPIPGAQPAAAESPSAEAPADAPVAAPEPQPSTAESPEAVAEEAPAVAEAPEPAADEPAPNENAEE